MGMFCYCILFQNKCPCLFVISFFRCKLTLCSSKILGSLHMIANLSSLQLEYQKYKSFLGFIQGEKIPQYVKLYFLQFSQIQPKTCLLLLCYDYTEQQDLEIALPRIYSGLKELVQIRNKGQFSLHKQFNTVYSNSAFHKHSDYGSACPRAFCLLSFTFSAI